MLIYQGEQLTFNGHLKDDNGNVITDLSDYQISAALCRKDTSAQVWSTGSSQDAAAITVGTGGLVTFALSGEVTRNLLGKYTFEAKITKISTGEAMISVSEDSITVAASNIGRLSDL